MDNQIGLFPIFPAQDIIKPKRRRSAGLTSEYQLNYNREYRKKNKDKIRAHNNRDDVKLRRKLQMMQYNHGVSPEWYVTQLEKQEHKCAICGRDFNSLSAKQIHIDHNHKTGVVRAILCGGCNVALGAIKENPEIARKIIEYLQKHNENSGLA